MHISDADKNKESSDAIQQKKDSIGSKPEIDLQLDEKKLVFFPSFISLILSWRFTRGKLGRFSASSES